MSKQRPNPKRDRSKGTPPFSPSVVAQPIFAAIHLAICNLPNEQAAEVLEAVACQAEAMADGIREEMND